MGRVYGGEGRSEGGKVESKGLNGVKGFREGEGGESEGGSEDSGVKGECGNANTWTWQL